MVLPMTVKNTSLEHSTFSCPTNTMSFNSNILETKAPNINCYSAVSAFDHHSNEIIEHTSLSFRLNEKQNQAFCILSTNFIETCIKKTENVHPLCLLLTGPGGTGKTHVMSPL